MGAPAVTLTCTDPLCLGQYIGVAVIVASPASEAMYKPVTLIVPLSADHSILVWVQPAIVLAANCCVWVIFIETEAGLMITGAGKAELKQLRETAATICKSGFISSPFLGLTGLAALQLHVDEHQAVKRLLRAAGMAIRTHCRQCNSETLVHA